ncbi:peptide/nickel transport system permease protein [Conyzicola lurida]|uniref:Peptide/nickel transport system permease protein n=1 Tax=Conyzicola lurida TaxID=1172621 RepID=A0A841AM60_9MICO|nr:ABC transporter permease [Conyzicola lurida]MBB5842821.1 peptide/nickel transport system permease protein [Conyzicola lurida]
MTSLLDKQRTDATPTPAAPVASQPARPRRRRRPSPSVLVAGVFVVVLLVAVAVPQLFTAVDPYRTVPTDGLKAPSAEHLFGTDRLGRDIFSRVIHGARYSILIGLSATAIAVVAGSILGLISGLSGRLIPGRLGLLVDEALGRVFDVISSFPGVLLAMVVVTFAGPGVQNIAVAIGIASIPMYGRVVRSQTLLVTRADFVTHAAVYGRTRSRVVIEHVLPNVLVAIPVLAAIDVGASILAVSGLSFLGLGPQAPIPEWGVMLAESRDVLRIAWWGGLFPGLFITASVIALTVLGRALQRHIDGRNS